MNSIKELLTTYPLVDIILILFLAAFSLKEVIQLSDFFKGKNKEALEKENETEELEDRIIKEIDALEEKVTDIYKGTVVSFEQINQTLAHHQEILDRLVASDKDDIRADIVKQYHFFMAHGYIDDFSMDALERRYSHYKAEGGNSYVSRLMEELRQLPVSPVVTKPRGVIDDN